MRHRHARRGSLRHAGAGAISWNWTTDGRDISRRWPGRWRRCRKAWHWARGDIDDPALLHQQERLVKKGFLLFRYRLALGLYPYIQSNQAICPAGQVNEAVINTGAASLQMDQPAKLKIKMECPHPHGIA